MWVKQRRLSFNS